MKARVKKTTPRRTARCDDAPPDALLHGIEEFNRQEFFEQHETIEAIWIHEADEVRYLYQGILQVGVGFHHWRRGNWREPHRFDAQRRRFGSKHIVGICGSGGFVRGHLFLAKSRKLYRWPYLFACQQVMF